MSLIHSKSCRSIYCFHISGYSCSPHFYFNIFLYFLLMNTYNYLSYIQLLQVQFYLKPIYQYTAKKIFKDLLTEFFNLVTYIFYIKKFLSKRPNLLYQFSQKLHHSYLFIFFTFHYYVFFLY